MKKLEIRYGSLMLLSFIAFFFLMKGLGLYTNVNLRVLNILIHITFVYLAMRSFRKAMKNDFRYLEVFLVGVKTSLLPVLGFSLFQFLYLTFLDPSFMLFVKKSAIMGSYLNPALASIFLVIEGFGVTLFASYVGMRYLTVKENVPPIH